MNVRIYLKAQILHVGVISTTNTQKKKFNNVNINQIKSRQQNTTLNPKGWFNRVLHKLMQSKSGEKLVKKVQKDPGRNIQIRP